MKISAGSLSKVQAKASAAVSGRLASLRSAEAKVSSDRWLTSSDRSTLEGIYSNDASGLTALGAKISSDTAVAQARSDYHEISTAYRVYLLALRQRAIASRADRLTGHVVPGLAAAYSRLEAKQQAKGSSDAAAAIGALSRQIQDIQSAVNGVSSQVLAFTPAQLDANRALLGGVRQSLASAGSDVRSARSDIRTARKDLK